MNHPPRGVQPNVLRYPLDLMADEHPALHAFLPVHHFRPPAAGQPIKQTVVSIYVERVWPASQHIFANWPRLEAALSLI